jgi:hypothetical protein
MELLLDKAAPVRLRGPGTGDVDRPSCWNRNTQELYVNGPRALQVPAALVSEAASRPKKGRSARIAGTDGAGRRSGWSCPQNRRIAVLSWLQRTIDLGQSLRLAMPYLVM